MFSEKQSESNSHEKYGDPVSRLLNIHPFEFETTLSIEECSKRLKRADKYTQAKTEERLGKEILAFAVWRIKHGKCRFSFTETIISGTAPVHIRIEGEIKTGGKSETTLVYCERVGYLWVEFLMPMIFIATSIMCASTNNPNQDMRLYLLGPILFLLIGIGSIVLSWDGIRKHHKYRRLIQRILTEPDESKL